MDKLTKYLKSLGAFTFVVVTHHYGSKLLDRNAELEADRLQAENESTLNNIQNELEELKIICKDLSERGKKMDQNITISDENINSINGNLSGATKTGSGILEQLKNNNLNEQTQNEIGSNITSMINRMEEIRNLLDELKKGTNKFISGLDKFYEYLDSLTLLQESAFIHILIFVVLICTIINILSVLFANEFIKYFDLENKYPSLAFFFKLRSKFQKFYLFWNILLLLFMCIAGIGLNLLVFYTS